MVDNDSIKEICEKMKKMRRDLHKIPEIGFEEKETAKYIIKQLDSLDIEYERDIATTGVIAVIKGYEGSRTIAFRGDMDALEMEEKNDVDFKSQNNGRMHACGHDGHMAILLGLACYLRENRKHLRDNVVLIFQPAEEGPGGALPIIEGGYLEKYCIDEIYGLHIFPGLPEGIIGVKSGPMMSQTGEFDIIIKGVSGHGAMPHTTIDSIAIGAQLIVGMQAIISRSINPIEPAVLTIGRMYGGERRNVIAGETVLEGTIRSFTQVVYDKIKHYMKLYIEGFERIHQCEIEIVFRDMYPAVNNDPQLTEKLIKSLDGDRVEIVEPVMLAEDFSYYQQKYPGVFFFLGSKSNEYYQPLHNNLFNFNEDILLCGLKAYISILKNNNGFNNEVMR